MNADLDALDRGVIDAGMTAAEALALAKTLAKRLDDMERAFALMADYRAGPPAARPRHLQLVEAAAPIYYCPVCGSGSTGGVCPRGCGGRAS